MSTIFDTPSSNTNMNMVSDINDLKRRKQGKEYPWMSHILKNQTTINELPSCLYHQELLKFAEWVSPTPEERMMRTDVVERIKSIIIENYPDAKVEVYGSFDSDLCVPQSDIDLVVLNTKVEVEHRVSSLAKLAMIIHKSGLSKFVPSVISTTKVPIIKLIDKQTKCLVDISFECETGIYNTRLIKQYLEKFPNLRPLALILKYYLKLCYLNDTWTGGIGSYTLLILIISYLQNHTESKGLSIENNEKENMAIILIGFLDFYGNKYDYGKSVISVLNDGECLSKDEKEWFDTTFPDRLSVEDPQNPQNDLGRASFNIERVKLAFQKGYELLSDLLTRKEVVDSFVSRLIHVPPEELKHRNMIKMKYRHKDQVTRRYNPNQQKNTDESSDHKSNNVKYVNSNNEDLKKKKGEGSEEDTDDELNTAGGYRKRKKQSNEKKRNGFRNGHVQNNQHKARANCLERSKSKDFKLQYQLDDHNFPSLQSVYMREGRTEEVTFSNTMTANGIQKSGNWENANGNLLRNEEKEVSNTSSSKTIKILSHGEIASNLTADIHRNEPEMNMNMKSHTEKVFE